MEKIPSYLLNLAGEYRVCSELNKRGVFATVTYGNRKGADVYAISGQKGQALKIEVKTSQQKNFVTSITQKKLVDSPLAPDFWVLLQIQRDDAGVFKERFFVLSHQEICKAQSTRNQSYAGKYRTKHGRECDMSQGVDNVTIADVEEFENKWSKIVIRIGGPEPE